MRSLLRNLSLIAACMLLGACSSALRWEPDTHVVRAGDTVYSIAFQHGLDQHELLGWNRLDANGLIFPGQRLRLTAPAGYVPKRATVARRTAPAARGGASPPGRADAVRVDWRWPTDGQVIAGFGATAKTQSGVHISGRIGQPVRAAAGGEIVYAGSGLPGYGQLLIIKHTPEYLSAYGHNDKLLVGEGDRVTGGQQIARMGTGPGRRALLHFEIRRDGQPVNPLSRLPRR